MKTTKTFQKNQVAQLPTKSKWHSLFRSLSKFSKNFMPTRAQSAQQDREEIFK